MTEEVAADQPDAEGDDQRAGRGRAAQAATAQPAEGTGDGPARTPQGVPADC